MRLLKVFVPLLAVSIPAQSLVVGPDLPFRPRPVGDVDADGLDDYAGTLGSDFVVISSATGTAIPYLTRPAVGQGYFMAGDTNADGHDDVVWLQPQGFASNAIVLSGADATVLHTWSGLSPFFIYQYVLGSADFDADGFDDVVLAAPPSTGSGYQIRSGRTGAVLATPTASFESALIGDRDGDGYPDFVLHSASSGMTTVRRGPTLAATTSGPSARRPLGDVNCDGVIDDVLWTAGTTSFVDGATGMSLGSLPYTTASVPGAKLLGDLDGDGHGDVAVSGVATGGTPFAEVFSVRTLSILAGPGNLQFLQSLGDSDGDGRTEAWIDNEPNSTVQWNDPALPVASKMDRRGGSGLGSTGHRPRITTRGNCALGNNAIFDVRGALPTSISLLVIGGALDIDLAFLSAPGNHLYANPDSALLLLHDANGLAVQSFVMPMSPSLIGAGVSVQAANWDPAANGWGFVYSNAIDVLTNN